MKRAARRVATMATAAIAAVTVLLSGCAKPAVTSPGVSPDLKHSWEVNFNEGDAAAVAALYAPQAQLVLSGMPPIHGREAIRSEVEKIIRSGIKVRIATQQNFGAGDLAYAYGGYTMFEHEGGKEIERGSYIEVWRRRSGIWQIDLDVNATGAPVAEIRPATQQGTGPG
ncbi:MAG: DUF4440 domain-containing protein [Proteobacteria bacterium]|nr:DUF4440 domain-containing protein [Pseudomonadota bacterium]